MTENNLFILLMEELGQRERKVLVQVHTVSKTAEYENQIWVSIPNLFITALSQHSDPTLKVWFAEMEGRERKRDRERQTERNQVSLLQQEEA